MVDGLVAGRGCQSQGRELTMAVALEIGERSLANGLTLLAVRNPAVRTFAASAQLEIDLRAEARGEGGLVHLTGRCLEEGTKRRSGTELSKAIEEMGGFLEGEASGGSLQCPAEMASKGVRLLGEMVCEPAFPAGDVARVRDEVLTEIRADSEDPQEVARERFHKEAYGRHPYGRPDRGARTQVARLRPVDLRRFHRKWFVAGGGYVAAAGPAEPVEMLDFLEKSFEGMRPGDVELSRPGVPPLPAQSREIHLPMDREQVHVFVGHRGIRRSDPDYHALQVMDHILGTGPGFTSRIARRLRDDLGLCYSVHAGITGSAGEEPGLFMAYIGTSPPHRNQAVEGFLEEISRLCTTLPSESELRDVHRYLTGSFVFSLQRNTSLLRYAIRAKRFGLGFDYLHRYPALITAVTRQDVRRVAVEHLHADKVAVVSAGATEA